MNYIIKNQINPMDIFKLTMARTYKSMIGTCNVVFEVAIILLTFRFFNESSLLIKVILIAACLIFPVIQPVIFYMNAKKQCEKLPENLIYEFDDHGIHVKCNEEKSFTPWNKIRNIVRECGIIMIVIGNGSGYTIPIRCIEGDSEVFYRTIIEKTDNAHKA